MHGDQRAQLLKKDLQRPEAACDAALIEFGGNDCDYDWAQVAAHPEQDHQPKTPLPLFIAQLRDMIDLVRQKGMQPVMMTLPPLHAQRYFVSSPETACRGTGILRWLGDVQHIYRWHERYNAAVMRWRRNAAARWPTCGTRFWPSGITAICCAPTASIPTPRATPDGKRAGRVRLFLPAGRNLGGIRRFFLFLSV